MDVRKVEVKNNYVSMTFVPKGYDDIVMAETLFGNIVAEQYGQEIFEPFPHERSSFTEEDISRMISSSETTFFYNDEKGFKMLATVKDGAELRKPFQDEPYKRLSDFKLTDYKFWIKCIQPEEMLKCSYGWIDVKYQIQVGEHTLESYISEWSTSWDKIRHDLEHLIWHRETELHLYNEDDPTRIILRKVNALESTVEVNGGIYFNWEPLIRIEVIPNEFVKDVEPFVGYEKELHVINALYYGLQGLAKAYPETNDEDSEMTRQNVWNKLQSPLMEQYIERLLNGERERSHRRILQHEQLEIIPHVKKIIGDGDTDKQVEYLTDADMRRLTIFYREWTDKYLRETAMVVLPEPREEFIRNLVHGIAEKFIDKTEEGVSVAEVHKELSWQLYCALDRYRIKL